MILLFLFHEHQGRCSKRLNASFLGGASCGEETSFKCQLCGTVICGLETANCK